MNLKFKWYAYIVPIEQPNAMDFYEIIERIEANDPEIIEINLNNIKHWDSKQWIRLFKAFEEKNDVVQELNAANCNLKGGSPNDW